MADPTLPAAVSGERHEITGRAGRLSYYVAGEGEPLLLIHSINAAASAFEMSPIFERMKATRRVYAVDLPGYGFSDRSDRPYNIQLFVDAVREMSDLIARECGERAVDAVALSLSAEFLARAAAERPERFRTITLVTPTGFNRSGAKRRGPAGKSLEVRGLYKSLTFPLWGEGLFKVLVSEKSVRYFLRRTFGSKDVPPELVRYSYLTSHQPGASRAPFAFLSARLFSADIRNLYESLTLPVFVPHGTRGDFADFSGAEWARDRANWHFMPFQAGALPHFEQLEPFLAAFEEFLAQESI
ncbi:MAG TPA: alpha/beta hydrolase [Saliniramus sp.]|nr:alpha/beta hydrolase [Saliniramus sp.]